MVFVIILLVSLLVMISYGLFMRRRLYKQIDKVESRKIEIMNRPVAEEIAEVKKLKMTGQAEEKFEAWRSTWDEMITTRLPDIEEKLFDAEEAADQFKIKTARQIIDSMQDTLDAVEADIQSILAELHELIGSEAQNRIEIEQAKQDLKAIKKTLLTKRNEYGHAAGPLETEIDNIEQLVDVFMTTTEAGNYLQARDVVLHIKEGLMRLSEKVDDIPQLLKQSHELLISDLKELQNGCEEMISEGYAVAQFRIHEEIAKIKEEHARHVAALQQGEIAGPKAGIADISDRINQLYDLLEQEVRAKQYLHKEHPKVKPQLDALKQGFLQTKEEANVVQTSYELKAEDLVHMRSLEKKINETIKKANELNVVIDKNDTPSLTVLKELEQIQAEINFAKEAHEQFEQILKALRKDEVAAQTEIKEMKRLLQEAKRLVQKSNLPGLPEHYFVEYESAQEKITTVLNKMQEKPLNMSSIKYLLAEASQQVEKVYEQTKETVEDAELAEKVIQYGNRYRNRFPLIGAELAEAEHTFRMYDYKLALEQAAEAVEKVEPGAIQKLEEWLDMAKV